MKAEAYFLEKTASPLVRRELVIDDPGPGEALVEVRACGLCHTDLSYADGSVRPRHDLPLVLGHEITGRVVVAGPRAEHLVGRPVLVPAVLPCGDCEICRAGRGNACSRQKMPGNDIHGGFSTHVLVPAAPLVPLDDLPENVSLENLSVVADAVSTAYQAILRAGLGDNGTPGNSAGRLDGDAVLVVGAGGVGGFLLQMAHALGARTIACDVSAERLASAAEHGAHETVNVADLEPRAAKKKVLAIAREWGIPSLRHKVFEASGTPAGQLLAYSLLGQAATLVQVGYTFEKVTLRFSNLMAFDATVHGTWGCPPEAYPAVLRMIYDGDIVLEPFVEHADMSELDRLLDDMANHRLTRRMVLHPGK